MKRRWVIPPPPPAEAAELLGMYPPVFRQVLWNRGVRDYPASRDFLNPRPPAVPAPAAWRDERGG